MLQKQSTGLNEQFITIFKINQFRKIDKLLAHRLICGKYGIRILKAELGIMDIYSIKDILNNLDLVYYKNHVVEGIKHYQNNRIFIHREAFFDIF